MMKNFYITHYNLQEGIYNFKNKNLYKVGKKQKKTASNRMGYKRFLYIYMNPLFKTTIIILLQVKITA